MIHSGGKLVTVYYCQKLGGIANGKHKKLNVRDGELRVTTSWRHWYKRRSGFF